MVTFHGSAAITLCRFLRCGSAIFVAGAGSCEVVEVNVAVALGLACELVLVGRAGIAELLGRSVMCAVFTFEGRILWNPHFGEFSV